MFDCLPDLPLWAELAVTALSIHFGSSVVTAATPTRSKNKLINAGLKVLNFAAVNFGKNKNADG